MVGLVKGRSERVIALIVMLLLLQLLLLLIALLLVLSEARSFSSYYSIITIINSNSRSSSSSFRATARPYSSGRGEMQQGLAFLFFQQGEERADLVLHLVQQHQVTLLLPLLLPLLPVLLLLLLQVAFLVVLLMLLLEWGGKARFLRGCRQYRDCTSFPGRGLTHQLSQHAQFPLVQRYFFVVLALVPFLPGHGQHRPVYSLSLNSSTSRRRNVWTLLFLAPWRCVLLLAPDASGGHVDLLRRCGSTSGRLRLMMMEPGVVHSIACLGCRNEGNGERRG